MTDNILAHAFGDLIRRYIRVAVFHWKAQLAEDTGLAFTRAEAEFLPAALELVETPVSPMARWTGLVLVALLAVAILWSVEAQVDIVVPAPGKIIPSSRTKAIGAVEVARVRAIHVIEGQYVRAGDLLMELDTSVYEADLGKSLVDVEAAQLDIVCAQALIQGIETNSAPVIPPLPSAPRAKYDEAREHLRSQYLDFHARLNQFDGEIEHYSSALQLAREREQTYADLAVTHDVSMNAWSEKRQASVDLEGQLRQARDQRDSLVAETKRTARDAWTAASKLASTALEDKARAQSHVRLLNLTTPVDGVVQQLTVHTVGGAVPAAQTLMLIVPEEDAVEIEATIQDKDIGFVHEGQRAEIKIDAFDYTKHGTVHGRVMGLSKDAVEDDKLGLTYKAKIALGATTMTINGNLTHMRPGMSVKVEIKTGRRRVIDYLLSPLIRNVHESFNER